MATTVLRIFLSAQPPGLEGLDRCRAVGRACRVVGDKPKNLGNWLWDFAARPLNEEEKVPDNPNAEPGSRGFTGTLYKTDEFLQTQPYGTVPAAFSPDGAIGVFESNSILQAVARAGSQDQGLAWPKRYGRLAH